MAARGAASASRTRRTEVVDGAPAPTGARAGKPSPTTASRRGKAVDAEQGGTGATRRSGARETPVKAPKAGKTAETAEAAKSAKPARAAKSAKAAKPTGGRAKTAAAARPATSAGSAKGARSAKDARPASSPAKAASSSKSTRSTAAAAKSTKPAKASVPAQKKPSSQPAAGTAPSAASTASAAARLAVREDESPWTTAELAAVRGALEAEIHRLRSEIDDAESMISDLLRDAGEGAGDDQADAGTKTFEREHEMSLAANSRDMLEQTSRALARIDAGTYGVCESCGNPIGKRRLQAFPRATLCMTCKQREERR